MPSVCSVMNNGSHWHSSYVCTLASCTPIAAELRHRNHNRVNASACCGAVLAAGVERQAAIILPVYTIPPHLSTPFHPLDLPDSPSILPRLPLDIPIGRTKASG